MDRVKTEMLERGVIVTTSAPLGNVVRAQPPLSIEASEIDAFVARFDESLHAALAS